jgi:hypothetical protein
MMLIWAITDRRGMPKVQKAMGPEMCAVCTSNVECKVYDNANSEI